MYEKLPRRQEISCKVGGDVEDCSTGAAWTCFIFAVALIPVVGAFVFFERVLCGRSAGGIGRGVSGCVDFTYLIGLCDTFTVAFLFLAPKPVPEGEDDQAGAGIKKPAGGSTGTIAASPRDVERGPASPMGEVVKSPIRRASPQPQRRAATASSP